MSTPFSVDVDFSGPAAFAARVGVLLADMGPALEDYGEHRYGRVDAQFRDEVDPYGRAWAPLAEATIRAKMRTGAIAKKLQRTGHMRATWTYEVIGQEYREGFAAPYARYHQDGTDRMPRRMLMPMDALPPVDQAELEDAIAFYLNR